jgi:tetratricopeptide (TPR) repeat protein
VQRTDFALTDTNRTFVREAVRLLDGLPLAIELAAARIRVLSPAQLVERLKYRFSLLAGARGTAARQATLRAAIDWSWNLLTPWEQSALAQCSVFEGGFTLEAAEAVLELAAWPDAPSTLDAVQALVDKSLLRTWVPAAQGRYDIDEPYFGIYVSIREYAAEKLRANGVGEERAAQERHGRYFARFGTDDVLESLNRHGGVRRRQALAIELDNVVAACRRAVMRRDGEHAVATYRVAWEVLELLGPFAFGVDLGTQVLALDEMDSSLRAAALWIRARALHYTGRTEGAEASLAQALVLARKLRDTRQEGRILLNLGHLHRDCGRMDEARAHFDAALLIHRALGDPGGEGTVLGNLGVLYVEQGRMEEAQADFEAALAIHRQVGNRRSEGIVVGNLGGLYTDLGRMEDARAHHEAALAIHREVGNRRFEGFVLGNIGNMHFEQGRMEDARLNYEAALLVHHEVGDRRSEGIVLGNLGCLDFDLGQMEIARTHFEVALTIHREVGNRGFEATVLGNIGELHYEQGQIEQARECFQVALTIHCELGQRRLEGVIRGKLGVVLARDGKVRDARDSFSRADALLREVDDRFELARLLCARGKVELASGDADAARSALAEAETLAVAIDAGPASGLSRKIAELREALG